MGYDRGQAIYKRSDHPSRNFTYGHFGVWLIYSTVLNQIWAAEYDSGCYIDFLLAHSRQAFRELFLRHLQLNILWDVYFLQLNTSQS